MDFTFPREELLDLEGSLKNEYLLTNGRGGYCSSTILDCHTRKYHGLLVLPVKGCDKKFVLLSKLEPVVGIQGKFFRLSTNKFPFVYEPQGHKYIEKFSMGVRPLTVFRMGETVIERSVVMPRGEDAVLVRFDVLKAPKKVLLKLTPFLAFRDIHGLTFENIGLRPRPYPEVNGFKISPYEGLPDLFVQATRKNDFFPAPLWFKSIEYMKEKNRGFEYQEDLFSPGVFEFHLKEGDSLVVRAGLTSAKPSVIKSAWDSEVRRLEAEAGHTAKEKTPAATLKTSAPHYLLGEGRATTGITAGYHWFGEWGRDTMLSLCGLTLCCGRKDEALGILTRYAGMISNGGLPNIVGVAGDHSWNSADAGLLFIRAVRQYRERSDDLETVRDILLPPARSIMKGLLEGRNPIVRIGADGLLYAGTAETQVTWMDARVQGRPVTPRHRAAIELNALWHDGLRFVLGYGPDPDLQDAIARFTAGFHSAFWCEESGCFADVYRSPEDRDCSIRPNQLFVLASPYPFVQKSEAVRSLETIKSHLVTPYGLRTLSPGDSAYQPEYRGTPEERDAAYHQGMVWPWLIGVFTDSLLRWDAKGSAKKYVEETFKPLWTSHLRDRCLGHISEIFKPDPPFTPKGAAAQAWSLAETIRALDSIDESLKSKV
jgi:predicted glycogen debranching enzyme